jgi:PAS domain S-box-containing protein
VLDDGGKVRWLMSRGRPFINSDGKSVRYIGIVVDITERKQVEVALRESEERYRELFESSLDGIIITDLAGNILKVNHAFEKMLGYSMEELQHLSYQQLTPSRWHESEERIVREQIFEHGYSDEYEKEYIRKDGSIFPISVRGWLSRDKQGQPRGMWGLIRDITERKQMEDKLKQSVKQYKTLGDTIPYGVWITDAEGYCTFASVSFLELMDMSMEQVQKFGWMDRLPPEDVQPATDHWLHSVHTGEDFEHEHRFRAKDGSYRNVLAIGRPVRNDAGRIIEWVGLNLDVTERRKTEEALRESEARFRTLAENSPDIIARFDRQKRHIYANPAAAEPYGRSPEKIVGKTNSELGMSHELVKFWEGHYENVFIAGKPETMEFHYISPQGEEYYFNTRVVPEFVGSKVSSVLAISRDITDLKEAEAKLKETLDNLEEKVKERTEELEKAYESLKESEQGFAEAQKMAHIGNWDWNLITDEMYWSDEMYRIFGLIPRKSRSSYSEILSYVHHDDRECVDNAVTRALKGEPFAIDHRIVLASGEERTVHTLGEVIFDEENTPVRMKGIIQDITEQKKAEEALTKIEVVRKQEIHHRIKNNLQVISSLLDLQAETFNKREDIKDSEVLKAFRESQDRVISMALIHEELYKGGGFEKLNFSPYIEKLTNSLFLTYRLGNTDVSLNIDLEENLFFDMDIAVPLGIIVNELVSNSLKHAFTGKDIGEIRIRLHREEGNDASFILNISDNGVGIPEDIDIEDLESLGLQLVTTLVDQLDGELEMKRDNGTEFTVRFTVTEKNNQASVPAQQ